MGVQAIDNSGILHYRQGSCTILGFTPKVSYAFDATAKTVTVTDASVIPAGDTFKIIHVHVHDNVGGEVDGEINAAAGNVAIDVSTLDLSRPLNITATLTTVNQISADGSAYNLQAAGTLGTWLVLQNA